MVGPGGGLPRKGVGVEKLVPSLESFFLGFRGREPGMLREFRRDVPDPWGCSKYLCKRVKVDAHFLAPSVIGPTLCPINSECAKGAEKASCGEMVVQKGAFGESVSSLPP